MIYRCKVSLMVKCMINKKINKMTNKGNKLKKYQTNKWVRLTIKREKKISRTNKAKHKVKVKLMSTLKDNKADSNNS